MSTIGVYKELGGIETKLPPGCGNSEHVSRCITIIKQNDSIVMYETLLMYHTVTVDVSLLYLIAIANSHPWNKGKIYVL